MTFKNGDQKHEVNCIALVVSRKDTLVPLWILLALSFAIMATAVRSQVPVPPNVDAGIRQGNVKPKLNSESKELADDFSDYLIGLREVVANYRVYLNDYDDDVMEDYRPQLVKLDAILNSSPVEFDDQRLAELLDKQTNQLRKTEFHIKDSKTVYPMRLYRLVQGLRRELLSFYDLLQDDLLPRFKENGTYRTAVLAYVSAQLAEEQRAHTLERTALADEKKVLQEAELDDERARAELKRAEIQQKKSRIESKLREQNIVVTIPEIEVKTPKPPNAPHVAIIWDDKRDAVGSGLSRELGDTVRQIGSSTIKIQSKYGRVEVTGWERDEITAVWSIEVSGRSRKLERAFVDSADLQIRKTSSGFIIAPNIPQPSEKIAQFIQNELVIFVPNESPVEVDNLFGELAIAALNDGVRASNSYADLTIDKVEGGVTAVCSMGELSVAECKGNLSLKNAYSQIQVEDCSGGMEIENAYAPVMVTDCSGKLLLKNTGIVQIEDHVGNVTVENVYGEVEVSGVRGDLSINNQYQPVVARDINGNVRLECAYSAIELSNIKGDVLAVNKYGTINAEGLSGPLLLENEGGSTVVSLDDLLKGASRIVGKQGSIIISVPESANLLVRALSTGGSISTNLPMQITDRSNHSEGVLRLGRPNKDSLLIRADGSAIVINSER